MVAWLWNSNSITLRHPMIVHSKLQGSGVRLAGWRLVILFTLEASAW